MSSLTQRREFIQCRDCIRSDGSTNQLARLRRLESKRIDTETDSRRIEESGAIHLRDGCANPWL